jgi:tryptophan halogenase
MILKAKKIIIFGGGTTGWLTAAYMVNNIKFPCEITLIESLKIGPIGVGEGTQPATARFLYDAGLDPKTWMKPSDAVFKLGVEFEGWTEKNFFVDNDFVENTQIGPNLYTTDYFIDKPIEDYESFIPAYKLAKNNKSPKLAGLDTNYAQTGDRQFGAVHFSALGIVDSLKSLVGNRITAVDTEIIKINSDSDGITDLIDKEGNSYSADLYIDCTGFSSLLLGKELGVDFLPVNDILPCDRAVAMPKQYTNPKEECHPYTKATTMKAGWRWTIPIFNRIGNGYVYSSKYITPEEAEQELRDAIGEYEAKANHLTMKCGIHKLVAHKNVIAAGLSAGFVEPLEATGITFTTKAVEILTHLLNVNQGIWSNNSKSLLNESYQRMFWEIVAFVWAHYHFSTRKDTEFWKDISKQQVSKLPEVVTETIKQFVPSPHRSFFLHPESSFHVGHWFQVLHPGGAYEDHGKMLNGDIEKYAEYFIENQKYRTEKILEMFPNHYDFLKQWYER